VKKDLNDARWSFFYDWINDFDYEAGYDYALEVEVTEQDGIYQDVTGLIYTAQRVLLKTEKDSDVPQPPYF
jgi:hypothetical protein